MDEYQNPHRLPTPPHLHRLFNAFIVAMVLLLVALIVIKARADAGAQDQPICKAVNVTDYPPNARVAEWVGYPEGWQDMPAGLLEQESIMLYMDETITAGYALYIQEGELWIFPHWSFESRFDENDQHGGTHDLCPVIVYTLEIR